MRGNSVFRSAITGDDGEVDSGYLALYWLLVVVIGVIPVMCVGAVCAMWNDPAGHFDAQGLGIGVGSVCAGFATAAGGVGIFRRGDK